MTLNRITVAVADDYALVRQGLVNILGKDPAVRVVGQAKTIEEALRMCRGTTPDVLLLDTTLPDTTLTTAIRLVLSQSPETRIIAVADQSERNCSVLRGEGACKVAGDTGPSRSDCVVQAIRAGARGAIRLSDTSESLIEAVQTVYDGRYWVDGGATARVMESLFSGHDDPSLPRVSLTEREDLICRMISDGLSNKEIAARLSIAQQTVKNHVSTILRKSGLEDRLQIARSVLLRTPCPPMTETVSDDLAIAG